MWTMSGHEHDSNASFNPKICGKNVSTDTVTSLLGLNHDHQPGSNNSASRWNPTPQQLLALEEIYRLGTRTPTGEEIQHIAQHLRRFGKIEGKNVFYWFQNHKARERLRRRREVELRNCQLQNLDHNQSNEYKKESGLRRTIYRDEQAKNCNFKHSEGFVSNSMSKATNAKRLTNASTTTTLYSLQSNKRSSFNYKRDNTNVENEIKEIEILELFPLCSSTDTGCGDGTKKDIKVPIRTINTNLSPNQFFEFLPLKN